MCFSASASFVTGTALLAVGVATLRQARRPAELPFAAVPLLFGAQQGVEGALWVSLPADAAMASAALTQIYSFFSHVLWPVYAPLAALLLEPAAGRRKVLGGLLALGAATALYLLYTLVRFPITADAAGGHIRYLAPHFYAAGVMAAYLTATCASLLVSSHRAVVVFGVLTLASTLAAYVAYAAWFLSVWCFFAAVLSVVVWLYFRDGGPAPVGPPHKSSPSAG